MQQRRTVLKLSLAGLLAGILPGVAAAAIPPAGPVPVGHGMFLVDGWLLTAADLRRLGLDEP